VMETMASVRADVRWKRGTRRAEGATIHLVPHRGEERVVTLEPLATFQMRGLGYLHPELGHGHLKGDLVVNADRWKVEDDVGVDPFRLHIQQIVRATMGERVGVGVFEQLVLGPHEPSGFTEILDGAS
jgi:hypothetical protein